MSKILIVDDEAEILNPLEEMLKEEGFEVRAFTNPLKALDFLRTQSVDLAIFDIKMPELNGLDLLAACTRSAFQFTHYISEQ
jgi:DNA-binding response OmpR family regulator